MDRRSARPALLITAAALLAAAAERVDLRAARWLAPGSDRVAALTREPAECLLPAGDAATERSVAIGRAMFRAPLLLGGQAARAGLSCNACHVNGHGNADFAFPGLSGASGTADVTSSLMSTSRGDHSFNPVAIPSLYAAGRVTRRSPELEAFIRGLVVEEFGGAPPTAAVLTGLADYVRALDRSCTAEARRVTLAGHVADIGAAAASAATALQSGDTPTAAQLLLAARSALGRVAERYPAQRFPAEAATLRIADQELAAVLADRDEGSQRLAVWRSRLLRRMLALQEAEPRSLYARGPLASAIDGR